ncbi:unnamed protein product [Camellia sinensis]
MPKPRSNGSHAVFQQEKKGSRANMNRTNNSSTSRHTDKDILAKHKKKERCGKAREKTILFEEI